MNKKKQILGLTLMIVFLGIFLIHSPQIYNNYVEIPGIYKATYNFSGSEIGKSIPEGWNLRTQGAGNSFEIIEEFEEHQKVVKFKRGEKSDVFIEFNYYIDIPPPTKGFVEWYWASADVNNTALYFQIRGSSGDEQKRQVILYFDKNGIGLGANRCTPVEDNKWYHCRYVFDANEGEQGKYELYVNGELIIENRDFMNTNVPDLYVIMFYGSLGSKGYLDAIGFSWDPEYEMGDNLYLEKQIHPITIPWNFLFSGVLILTIICILNPNVSFPLVANSLVKYKIVKNKKYIRILNSVFLIFNKKLVAGSNKWNAYEGSNISIEAILEFKGYQEVMKIWDDSILGRGLIRNSIVSNHEEGSIKWHWKVADPSKKATFSLNNSDLQPLILIKIENGNIYAFNGKKCQNLQEFKSNQWYDMKIDFDCASNKYDLYINTLKVASDFVFKFESDMPRYSEFYSDLRNSHYCIYIADFKYCWIENLKYDNYI